MAVKRGTKTAIAAAATATIEEETGGDRRLLIQKTYRIDRGRAVRISLNDGRHLDFSAVATAAAIGIKPNKDRPLIAKTYRIDDGRAVRITIKDHEKDPFDFSALAVDAMLVEMSRQRRADAKVSR